MRGHNFLFFFFLLTVSLFSQSPDFFKKEAQNLMKIGKYGEAIEQLNKYISARPNNADGFFLRAQCYEARGQLENAVFDYRVAIRIAPNDKEIRRASDLATNKWYAILEDKIAGHKREIAMDPSIPLNYLEIAESYKHMQKWSDAESWYEAFMKKKEANADEILRYTEVLIKLRSFDKGEKISRVYNGKYPKDIRLWSRNGWFNVWLGRYKPAAESFKKALEIRPFFKEALEGLEICQSQAPYIFTYYDTVGLRQSKEKPKQEEYIIDKYYRLLKNNPEDDETRFALILELQKVDRLEEAFQQLQILADEHSGTERFDGLWTTVTEYRDSLYAKRIEEMTQTFEANPGDTTAAMMLADAHFQLSDFDTAIEVYQKHFEANPNTNDNIRFNYAKYLAYNQQFEPAIEQMNFLLAKRPDDLNYQLVRAQIAVWTTQDLDMAKGYLNNIITKEPNNLPAIIALTTISVKERDFNKALEFLTLAKTIDPKSKEVEAIQNYYDSNLELEEDRKNFEILVEARNLAVEQKCDEALLKYDEYFSKISNPSRFEQIEYADVNLCAGNFEESLNIYDRLLENEYDYDISLQRAKVYLWSGDSLRALSELTRLVEEDTSNFESRFYLAETYETMEEFDDAREIYSKLLESTEDTTRVKLINMRIGWLPKGSSLFSDIPLFVRLSPQLNYFGDNQGMSFMTAGGNIEVGILSFLSLGFTFTRSTLDSSILSNVFTAFKWNLFIYPAPKMVISAGLGNLSYLNQIPVQRRKPLYDASYRYIDDEYFTFGLSYEATDAVMVLFSSRLIYYNLDSEIYKVESNYYPNPIVKLTGSFNYITLADGNAGNNVLFRIGRFFQKDIMIGYEYQYASYNRSSTLYYSPIGFEAHAAWADWILQPRTDTKLTLSGKVGYIPASDTFLREISAQVEFKPTDTFILSVRGTTGGSFRYDAGYRYYSAFLSAFWSF
ncbi:MAG: tetratricopeptide repeat protein [Ignavibacteriaceae bacterium]|nr:tetratricopeptide repeat protein [Ignavibacteriaceae bacterium]